MMIDTVSALISAAETGLLRARPIVLLDWHDGPVEGIAELADPVSYWHFRLLGERASKDDLDDRVYALAQISGRAVERIIEDVGSLDEKPLVWPFNERSDSADVESLVEDALASAGAPTLLIQSTTIRDIKGIWRHVRGATQPQ